MKIETLTLGSQLVVIASAVKREAQKYIKSNAYDTGDMDRAVTVGQLIKTDKGYEITVFVDKNSLYNTRKKTPRSNGKYPIYVHEGIPAHSRVKFHSWAKATQGQIKYYTKDTPYGKVKSPVNVKARPPKPYFDVAYSIVKDRFKNMSPDIKVESGEVK